MLFQAIAFIENEEISIHLEERTSSENEDEQEHNNADDNENHKTTKMVFTPSIVDYIYRPDSLENTCYYDFCNNFYRTKSPRKISFKFQETHPYYDQYLLAQRLQKTIPIIYGPRLCNYKSDTFSDEAEQEAYAKHLLVLFYPFRRRSSFPLENGWYQCFRRCIQKRIFMWGQNLEKMLQYSTYIQDTYDSRAAARALAAARKEQEDGTSIKDQGDINLDALIGNYEPEFPNVVIEEAANDVSIVEPSKPRVKLQREERYAIAHFSKNDADFFHQMNDEQITEPLIQPQRHALTQLCDAKFEEAEKKVSNDGEQNLNQTTQLPRSVSSCIQLIRRTLRNWDSESNATTPLKELPPFASPCTVAAFYNLNDEQKIIFFEMTKACLIKWLQDITGTTTYTNAETDIFPPPMNLKMREGQLVGIIHGQAGCGKTYLIHVIRHFIQLWTSNIDGDLADELICAAPTNMAASAIDGDSIHAIFGINLDMNLKKNSKNATLHTESLQKCCLIILDEMSMIHKEYLDAIHQRLFIVTQEGNLLFGGKNIVLMGDFHQLRPVAGHPLYEKGNPIKLNQVTGYNYYHYFSQVFFLSQSIRQSQDINYANILQHLRYGHISDTDLETLNERTVDKVCTLNMETARPPYSNTSDPSTLVSFAKTLQTIKYIPFAVHNNSVRHKISDEIIRYLCSVWNTNLTLTRVPATISNTIRNQNVPSSVKEEIYKLRDNDKTSYMSPLLGIFIGMPVLIVKTVSKELGIIAGLTCRIVALLTDSENPSFKDIPTDERYTTRMALTPETIKYILVTPINSNLSIKNPLIHNDNTLIPIKRCPHTFTTTTTTGAKHHIRMSQFPIVPAFAVTITKLQGRTLDGIIITKNILQSGDKKAFYVACSRIKTLSTLYFTFILQHRELKEMIALPRALLNEIERLKKLAQKLAPPSS